MLCDMTGKHHKQSAIAVAAALLLLLCLTTQCTEASYTALTPDQLTHGQGSDSAPGGNAAGSDVSGVSNGDAALKGHMNDQGAVQYSRGSAPPLLQKHQGQPGDMLDPPFDDAMNYNDYEGVAVCPQPPLPTCLLAHHVAALPGTVQCIVQYGSMVDKKLSGAAHLGTFQSSCSCSCWHMQLT